MWHRRRGSQANLAFAHGHDFDVDVIAVGHDYFRTLGLEPLADRLLCNGAADRVDMTADAHSPPRPVVLGHGGVNLDRKSVV